MVSFPNIDKSAFRCGEYVGYSGGVWRIKKANPRGSNCRWFAQKRDGIGYFYARTLADVSEKLSNLDNAATVTKC